MKQAKHVRWVVLGIAVVLLSTACVLGQVRQEVRIPDIRGYKTLKCDFHQHTVFSDGNVWPTVRVEEAWREGLDAIAITDHIEYQPHKQDVPTNHNRPYEIALPTAKERGLLLIKGAEITRDTPPGHFNALFLEDVNPLDTKELLDAMAAADKQGAFIWWNHPDWKPEHKGWFDIHTTLYEKKYMRGIEVVNGNTYSPSVHQWALDKNLTFMGNTDIHDPCPLDKTTWERHRPMTLVFAGEKTPAGIKDALLNGRTTVWYNDQLIGRREYLQAIFDKAVVVEDVQRGDKTVRFAMANNYDIGVTLDRVGSVGPQELVIPPNSRALVSVRTGDGETPIKLSYTARNFLVEPKKGLPVSFTIPGEVAVDVEVELQRR